MQEGEILCPFCNDLTEHTTIKEGRETLVRCEVCGAVHPATRSRERQSVVRAIVSAGSSSSVHYIRIPADETISVGSEMLIDDGESDVVMAEVTAIETDRRVESALASDMKTVWGRAVDEVPLKIAIYRRGKTRSFKIPTPGTVEFHIGDTGRAEGVGYEIVKIKTRDGNSPRSAQAKDIVRIWGRQI